MSYGLAWRKRDFHSYNGVTSLHKWKHIGSYNNWNASHRYGIGITYVLLTKLSIGQLMRYIFRENIIKGHKPECIYMYIFQWNSTSIFEVRPIWLNMDYSFQLIDSSCSTNKKFYFSKRHFIPINILKKFFFMKKKNNPKIFLCPNHRNDATDQGLKVSVFEERKMKLLRK